MKVILSFFFVVIVAIIIGVAAFTRAQSASSQASDWPTLAPGETYPPSDFPTLAPGETYPPSSEFPTLAPGETYPPHWGFPTLAPGQTYPPYGFPTLAPGETYPSGGSFSGMPPVAPTNPDVQILRTIEAKYTAANPLPAAPTCPTQFQNGNWDAMLTTTTLSFSQEQGATWFAGNFSSQFPNGFDLQCLLNYWNSVKYTVTEVDCIHNGGWSGGSNTGLPPSDFGTSSGAHGGSNGGTTENPLSSMISELISSVMNSVMESMLQSTAAPAPQQLDANYEQQQEDRNAHAQGSSMPSGPDPNAPSSNSMGSETWPTDAPVSGYTGSSDLPTIPQAPTGTTPACVPFGNDAKCIMLHNDLLRTMILAAWKKTYPGCFCTTDCPTVTTVSAPPRTQQPTLGPFTTTAERTGTPSPISGGTTQKPTGTTSSPASGSTTQKPPALTTTQAPMPGGTTTTQKPAGTNTPAPVSGGTTPSPVSGGTTATQKPGTPAPISGGTTAAPPRTTATMTSISTAKPTTPAPIPEGPTTTTTTASPGDTTTSVEPAAPTTTNAPDAPATNAPPARPTTATATLTGAYNQTKILDMLVAQLKDSPSNFQISLLGNSTVEVKFSGPNAANNAEDFAKLDINALESASLASPSLMPETTVAPTPAPEGSNLAMFAGIAIGALVVIAAIAFLVYRNKKNSSGDGQKLNFNLDYDEEAFLGKYGDEMESMASGNGSPLRL